MSNSNKTRYQIAEETGGYGVSPAGTYQELRKQSSSIRGNPSFVSSDEANTSGNITDSILTDDEGGGPLDGQFSSETYDIPIEAVLRGSFTSLPPVVDSVGWDDTNKTLTGDFSGVGAGTFLSVRGFPSPQKPNVYRAKANGDAQEISVEEFGNLDGGGAIAGAAGQKAEPGDFLGNGTTDRSFTIEAEQLDHTSDTYIRRFSGFVFNGWTFNAPLRGPITTQFSGVCNPPTLEASSAGSGVTAANMNSVMDGRSSKRAFGLVLPDGTTAFSTCLVDYSHQVQLPVTRQECQGPGNAIGFSTGRPQIEGRFQLYLRENANLYELIRSFDSKQLISYLYFSYLDEQNKGYTFAYRDVRLTQLDEGIEGPDTDVFLPFSFSSFQKNGTNSMFVTRYIGN